jgi:hypothetical protein
VFAVKDFLVFAWGESWSDPLRWASLGFVALLILLAVLITLETKATNRWIAAVHARGGRIRYRTTMAVGISPTDGNVVVTPVTTMHAEYDNETETDS